MHIADFVTILSLIAGLACLGLYISDASHAHAVRRAVTSDEIRKQVAEVTSPSAAGEGTRSLAWVDMSKTIEALAKLIDSLAKAGPSLSSLIGAVLFFAIAAISSGALHGTGDDGKVQGTSTAPTTTGCCCCNPKTPPGGGAGPVADLGLTGETPASPATIARLLDGFIQSQKAAGKTRVSAADMIAFLHGIGTLPRTSEGTIGDVVKTVLRGATDITVDAAHQALAYYFHMDTPAPETASGGSSTTQICMASSPPAIYHNQVTTYYGRRKKKATHDKCSGSLRTTEAPSISTPLKAPP